MPPHRAWIQRTLLFFATALSFPDRRVLSVLAPELSREFGMTNAVYSRVVFACVLSYTVMFALARRPWVLGISRFFLGAGEGPCSPAATKGAVEWMPPQERALAVGLRMAGRHSARCWRRRSQSGGRGYSAGAGGCAAVHAGALVL